MNLGITKRLLARALVSSVLMTCLIVPATVRAKGIADPLDRPALMSTLASHAVLLDIARAGQRLVAVGERGIVLLSDDKGNTWRQALVPVSVSLTAVAFASPKIGWAVGHSGVILKTDDGGEHWKVQMDGRRIAAILAAAPGVSDAAAQRWARAGADKPLLALHVDDERSVQVVGAYGLAFRSRNGGAKWDYFGDRLDNPRSNHLYSIAVKGRNVIIAGEQGVLFFSKDDGKSFKRIYLPYQGTLFDLVPTSKGLYVTGMKGNLFYSADSGAIWRVVTNPIASALIAGTRAPGGGVLWINEAGQLLAGTDDSPLAVVPTPPAAGVISFLPVGDKQLVTVGYQGVTKLPLVEYRGR